MNKQSQQGVKQIPRIAKHPVPKWAWGAAISKKIKLISGDGLI